jgi:hypothetical protein
MVGRIMCKKVGDSDDSVSGEDIIDVEARELE